MRGELVADTKDTLWKSKLLNSLIVFMKKEIIVIGGIGNTNAWLFYSFDWKWGWLAIALEFMKVLEKFRNKVTE